MSSRVAASFFMTASLFFYFLTTKNYLFTDYKYY